MSKTKVLHVVAGGDFNIGGVQSLIMSIAQTVPNLQHDVIVFSSKPGYYDEKFQDLGGSIHRLPDYKGKNKIIARLDYYFFRLIRLFFGTYKILKKSGPYNAIHSNNDLESGICNMAAYLAGVKVRISHAHTMNSLFIKGRLVGNIYRKILQKLVNVFSNVKIGCSKEAFNSMFGSFKKTKKSKSFIMHNPIDLNTFLKKHYKPKKSKNINLVHVGRYSPNKNQIFLIEMLPYILEVYPNTKLKLIGYRDRYKNYTEILNTKAEFLGVSSHIEFLPTHTDIRQILDEADLFVFPSIREGFGIALIEAQAMEVPCLVSDSVPREVDLGLCEFLPLSSEQKIWANQAIDIIEGNTSLKLNKQKLKALDVKEYAKNMELLYLGK